MAKFDGCAWPAPPPFSIWQRFRYDYKLVEDELPCRMGLDEDTRVHLRDRESGALASAPSKYSKCGCSFPVLGSATCQQTIAKGRYNIKGQLLSKTFVHCTVTLQYKCIFRVSDSQIIPIENMCFRKFPTKCRSSWSYSHKTSRCPYPLLHAILLSLQYPSRFVQPSPQHLHIAHLARAVGGQYTVAHTANTTEQAQH